MLIAGPCKAGKSLPVQIELCIAIAEGPLVAGVADVPRGGRCT